MMALLIHISRSTWLQGCHLGKGLRTCVNLPRRTFCVQHSHITPSQTPMIFSKIHHLSSYRRSFHHLPNCCVSRCFSSQPQPKKDPKSSEQYHQLHPTIMQRLHGIEDSLRFHGYSTLRIGLALLMVSGLGIYFFREHIRENVADEVSQLAHRSLGDDTVKQKAEEMSKALLHAILTDTSIQKQATTFLSDILGHREVKSAAADLVIAVLNDPPTQRQMTAKLKLVVQDALSDPEFRGGLVASLSLVLRDEETKCVLVQLLKQAFSEEEVKVVAKVFAEDIVSSPEVYDAGVRQGKGVAQGVLGDPDTQRKAGEGLRSALAYAVTPNIFSGNRNAKSNGDNNKNPETVNIVISSADLPESTASETAYRD